MEPSSTPWRVIESPDPQPSLPAPGEEPRDRPLVAIGAVLIAVVVAVLAFLLAARPDPVIEVDGALSVQAGSAVEGGTNAADPGTGGTVVIEVGGAVARPGVYRLEAGARIGDAIAAAGGYGARVDIARADRQLNLAAPVRDGDEIRVPARGESDGVESAGSASDAGGGGLIDVNRASAEQLDTLPGVGPATAAKIIAAREEQPFASVDDLQARRVLGPATLEKVRSLVTVGP